MLIYHTTYSVSAASEANFLIYVRQVLVPAAEEFIAHIDFEERRIHLVLPEGLLDLE